jgi:hypothetical protein
MLYQVHFASAGFERIALVVTGTDCPEKSTSLRKSVSHFPSIAQLSQRKEIVDKILVK